MSFDESALPLEQSLRFGPALRFELQPAEGRLLVDGQPAALGRRALDLLVVLASRPDHLLTKHELLDRVWPGLVVEEANLQMQISNLRKLLGGDVIATVPGRGYRCVAAVSRGAAEAASGSAAAISSAPAPAPAPATDAALAAMPRLIGRADDLAQLEALLAQHGGCVTLVGSSGVGKTSLARAVAARRQAPSVWVDLASLTQGRQIAGALARALDMQLDVGDDAAPAQLAAALRARPGLVVLDNAEHLLDACAALAALLAPLPGVHVLVTSQAPLAIGGERVMRLHPLGLESDANLGDGALALLVERIVAADHRFRATPAALPMLRAVCAQLDGLPLALEMAAARVPLLGLQGVHDALAERFALLTRGHRDAAGRHRTLHNALDWSYDLLGPDEQRLFRALGVFADGCTLDLAVALMAGQGRWDVVEQLAALADRSLIVVGAEDPPRYRLLETMRAYALEQSARAGEAADTRARHAAAMLDLFARYTVGDAAARDRCMPEMENARDAIAWAAVHDLGAAARLSARVTLVTTYTAWRHESGNWLIALEPAMDGPAGRALPAQDQATWWAERARVATIRRAADAPVAARRAVALWRPLGQPNSMLRATLVWVRTIPAPGAELDEASASLRAQVAALPDLTPRERLNVQGALTRAALVNEDLTAVLAGREIELALGRSLGDHDVVDAVETNIVNVLGRLGRSEEGAQRGLALLARLDGDGRGTSGNLPWVYSSLADVLLDLGRHAEVRALLPRMFAVGRRFNTPLLLLTLCGLAIAERRFEAAAQLIGHTQQAYASRGIAFEGPEIAGVERLRAQAAAALGQAQADALIQQGRALDTDAAEAISAGAAS